MIAKQQQLPWLEDVPQEGVWVEVAPVLSRPCGEGQSWKDYPHLDCRREFGPLIRHRAELFHQCLVRQALESPVCQLCGTGAYLADDLAGPKHWTRLWTRIQASPSMVQLIAQSWNEHRMPGGKIRMNELDGRIHIFKEPSKCSVPCPSLGVPLTSVMPTANSFTAPAPDFRDDSESEWSDCSLRVIVGHEMMMEPYPIASCCSSSAVRLERVQTWLRSQASLHHGDIVEV
ncbi:unnamed protein product [Durusdinium trenchii]|uniref:Uncharacterized protein n=1 Tax=Durusdinium trenchii TaxID=1381693 RepID=A0ABP0IPW6_9DINO